MKRLAASTSGELGPRLLVGLHTTRCPQTPHTHATTERARPWLTLLALVKAGCGAGG